MLVVHTKQLFRLALITRTPYLDHDEKLLLVQSSYGSAQAWDDMISKAPEQQYTKDKAFWDVDQNQIIGVVIQNFKFWGTILILVWQISEEQTTFYGISIGQAVNLLKSPEYQIFVDIELTDPEKLTTYVI